MKFHKTLLPVLAILPLLASPATAALVSFNTSTDFSAKSLFQADGTTSYAAATANGEVNIGNNTANAADNVGIWASFGTTHTLANAGDTITLTGLLTLTSILNASDQIRAGLFNSNGSANATGWLGYFGSNDVLAGATSAGTMYERSNPNTGTHASATGAASLGSNNIANVDLVGGTQYSFSLTLTRNGSDGIDYALDMSEAANASNKLITLSGTDTTPQTFAFDRAGFLIGGNLDADQAQFRNVDVTFTPVPEPSVALLGGLSLLGLLRRRRA